MTKRTWILVWGGVGILLFFILVSYVRGSGMGGAIDVARGESASVLAALLRTLTPDGSLEAEVARLKGVEEEYARTLVIFEALRSENLELRALLGAIESSGGIPAAVVMRPPQLPYDTLLLEAPGDVAPGSLIVVDNEVIGLVEEDEGAYVRAKLLSAAKSEISVMLASSSIALTLEGRGGGLMSVSVPKDVAVSLGEAVIAPSLHTRVVGSVVDIVADEHLPSKVVYVRSSRAIERLRMVTIVSP